jgi:hypothetical protein
MTAQRMETVLRHPDHGHLYVSASTWNDPIYAFTVAKRDGFFWVGSRTLHTDKLDLLPYLWFEGELRDGEWADPRDWPAFATVLAAPEAYAELLRCQHRDLNRRIRLYRDAERADTSIRVIKEIRGPA